ncbi:MAG: CHC2 zinc finger domain-containing protein, partial [Acidiferrobacter thiooxydans]
MSARPVNIILPLLDKVAQLRDGSWMALCPAHDDRNASLHVTELADGRVIFHCYAGCGGADVVEALGLRFGDLKPDGLDHTGPTPVERDARKSLQAVAHAALVTVTLLNTVAAGKVVSEKQSDLAGR